MLRGLQTQFYVLCLTVWMGTPALLPHGCVLDMQEKDEFQLPEPFFWEFEVPQGLSGRGRKMGEESIIHV